MARSDRVLSRSRAKRLKSPVARWLAVALASECKGTVERELSIGRLTLICRRTLSIKNPLLTTAKGFSQHHTLDLGLVESL